MADRNQISTEDWLEATRRSRFDVSKTYVDDPWYDDDSAPRETAQNTQHIQLSMDHPLHDYDQDETELYNEGDDALPY